jgi:hypothetical protein
VRSRLLEIDEVLQVRGDKEGVRAVDVVEVAMIGRAERSGVIGVAKMREGYEVWEQEEESVSIQRSAKYLG